MKKGHQGTSLGGRITQTKGRVKRESKRRRRQEQYWASRNGPVATYRLDPETGERVPVENG